MSRRLLPRGKRPGGPPVPVYNSSLCVVSPVVPSTLLFSALSWVGIWSVIPGLPATAFAQAGYHPGVIMRGGRLAFEGRGGAMTLYDGGYILDGGGVSYLISNCARFKVGQTVEFLVDSRPPRQTLYISEKKGGVLSCTIVSATDPLGDAVFRGDLEKMKSLLKDNPDLIFTELNGGLTPLHWAKNRAVAELLLASNANVNAKSDVGGTPLYEAAGSGYKDVVEVLLANGADLNSRIYDRRTLRGTCICRVVHHCSRSGARGAWRRGGGAAWPTERTSTPGAQMGPHPCNWRKVTGTSSSCCGSTVASDRPDSVSLMPETAVISRSVARSSGVGRGTDFAFMPIIQQAAPGGKGR